jgi:hypothetical protein
MDSASIITFPLEPLFSVASKHEPIKRPMQTSVKFYTFSIYTPISYKEKWDSIADFTSINKDGIDASIILKYL